MRPIWLLPLLFLTALFVMPPAAADPGYECADGNITEKYLDEGKLQVNMRRDCSLEVVAFEGLICVGGWGGVIERDIGGHTVRAYYCTGGPLPEVATTSAGCPAYETDSWAGYFATHNDCSLDAHFIDAYRVCSGSGLGWDRVGTEAGPLATSVGYCTPQVATTAADPCNGIWYASGSKTLPTGTTVSYGTNLQPGCTELRVEHGVVDCTADLKPDCEDIWIDVMSCVWNGSWKTYKAGVTNIHIYTCDNNPPDALRSTASDPLPGPGSCGIVVHQYEVGPISVASSGPCLGVGVDPFGDACVQDHWVGVGISSVTVAVNACTPHMPPP